MSDAPTTSTPQPAAHRLASLDALRGLIMALMALDHTNHFIGKLKGNHELWTGPFPRYASNWQALVARVITHPAAPGFALLMGMGVALFCGRRREQGWSGWEIASRLVVRGLLLIVLQITLVNPVWGNGLGSGEPIYFGVLWALGVALIVSPALERIPAAWLAGASALLLVSIQALLPTPSSDLNFQPLMRLVLAPGYAGIPRFAATGNSGLYVLYPVLPWLGIVGLGLAAGKALAGMDTDQQRETLRRALWLGLGMIAAWAVVRGLGGYGNIRPMPHASGISIAAWLNMCKYPPSLAYVLLYLGLDLVALGLLARYEGKGVLYQGLTLFGRNPLVFYVAHVWWFWGVGRLAGAYERGLWAMLPFWLLGLANMIPVCVYWGRWRAKQDARSWWRLV